MRILFVILLTFLFNSCGYSQHLLPGWAMNTGGEKSDYAYCIRSDRDGNIYMTGYFEGTADLDPGPGTCNLVSKGSTDIFLAKYNPSGKLLWAKSYGGKETDYGTSLAIDDSFRIFLTGVFQSSVVFNISTLPDTLVSAGSEDIFISCIDSSGKILWLEQIGGTLSDISSGIESDCSGNIYLCGYFKDSLDFDPGQSTFFLSSTGKYDAFLVKLTVNGKFEWALNAGGSRSDYSTAARSDGAGSVYMTGYFTDMADFDPTADTSILRSFGNDDIFLAKYDSNGRLNWAKNLGGAFFDYPSSLYADHRGNLYLTGCFDSIADFNPGAGAKFYANGGDDIFVARYDTSGRYLWADIIGGKSNECGMDVTADSIGGIYVTGYFEDSCDFNPGTGSNMLYSEGYWDVFIAKYDTAGQFVTARSLGGHGVEMGNSLCIGQNGNIYITGFMSDTVRFTGNHNDSLISCGAEDIFIATYIECGKNNIYHNEAYICPGDTFIFPDSTIAVHDTVYTSRLKSYCGCDSLVETTLSLQQTYSFHMEDSICKGSEYTFPDGTKSGKDSLHCSMLKSSFGCDSLVFTHLRIDSVFSFSRKDTICRGDTFIFPDGYRAAGNNVHSSYLKTRPGCDSIIIDTVTVYKLDTSVTKNNNSLIAQAVNASYRWINCNDSFKPVPGETGKVFKVNQNGVYAVIITARGCSDTSTCIQVIIIGITNEPLFEFNVFPNPVNNDLNIRTDRIMPGLTGIILDARGISVKTFNSFDNTLLHADVSQLSNGLYLLILFDREKNCVLRKVFVKE